MALTEARHKIQVTFILILLFITCIAGAFWQYWLIGTSLFGVIYICGKLF